MENTLALIKRRLEARPTLPALSPKLAWDSSLDDQIADLPLETTLRTRAAEAALIALRAGMYLLNDNLDASHSQSQEIEDDATGAYWHGIMHRMEGDYSNANYWFSQAGAHPAMEKLQVRVADWIQNSVVLGDLPDGQIRDALLHMKQQVRWNPNAFTSMVALQESGALSEETRSAIEYVQHMELIELFDYTCEAAKRVLET
ncbi:hypothetical protein [Paenibacillus sp. OV219]|uniref:hypothetical protein n=1 Tax=Paenibacillus sp. OV219 TaxID=1884377 RepID=UPI0008AD7488|nr:hypothetical protein [Paenibacillus sp. OV219]SEN79101.1 hypothetical protein SAMN05518847_104150 [Paenibacillus sp. OV219]